MTIDRPRVEQTSALRPLWQEAFGDSQAYLDSFFTLAFSPDRCRCMTEGNRVTAAVYWFDCSCGQDKIAYVYASEDDFSSAFFNDFFRILHNFFYATVAASATGKRYGAVATEVIASVLYF